MTNLATKLAEPINDLKERARWLEPHLDRDLLRTNVLNVRRLCERMVNIIQTDILTELQSNRPLPEHGFVGNGPTPRPKICTIDDL